MITLLKIHVALILANSTTGKEGRRTYRKNKRKL